MTEIEAMLHAKNEMDGTCFLCQSEVKAFTGVTAATAVEFHGTGLLVVFRVCAACCEAHNNSLNDIVAAVDPVITKAISEHPIQ